MNLWFRCNARRLAAILIVAGLYVMSRQPALPAAERGALAGQFSFERHTLPEMPGYAFHYIRPVHPWFSRISNWTSAVGAAVSIGDVERTGLPNVLCYVDTRIDQLIVAPVPARGDAADQKSRFTPFVLDPSGVLPYDSKTMAPMGSLLGDFAENGYLDVLVYYWGRTPVVFMRRPPADPLHPAPLTAADFTPVELMPSGSDGQPQRWFTNAAVQADLDGDGHADLVFANYHPDGARVLDASATTPAVMQDSMSHACNGGAKHFLLWKKPAASQPFNFVEQQNVLCDVDLKPLSPAAAEPYLHGWTLAIGAADLDGDLLPEIYLANDFGCDRLLHNVSTPGHLAFTILEGVRHFTTPKSKVVGHDSFKGMGVDFADLSRDGNLDIFVSDIADEFALQESHLAYVHTGHPEQMKKGIAPYDEKSEELGLSRSNWAWDAKFGDFTNEGNVELIQCTGFCRGTASVWPWLHELATANDALLKYPQVWFRCEPGDGLSYQNATLAFFARDRNGRFWNVGRDVGFTEPSLGRGIATADVEGNGRLDFAVANQYGPSYFYYNGLEEFLGTTSPPAAEAQRRGGLPDRRWPSQFCRYARSARDRRHGHPSYARWTQRHRGS
jgi:enediyne biosynthesis protein E4